ncbi:hypothetical protein ACLX1H_000960 [Fusarium chlamydosporum]
MVGYGVGGIGATIWQCIPVAGAWDKWIEANCIDSDKFWVGYAVLNVVADIVVVGLPILPVIQLQMNMREKLLVCGVFVLGSFVTITSILRATSVSNSLENKGDQTYNLIERRLRTLIKTNLGIMTTCLPVLRQPLGKLFPRIIGTAIERSAYFADAGNYSKGYNFSDLSARISHPLFWRSDGLGSSQIVSARGPDTSEGRESDER